MNSTQYYYLNKIWPMINRWDVLFCPVFGTKYVALENTTGRYVLVADDTGRKTHLKRGEFR